MTAFYWTLPTGVAAGEPRTAGSSVRDVRAGHYSRFDHLAHVARAAEVAGFDGIVVAHDERGDDPWVVASAVARHTRWLQMVTGFGLGQGTPVYTAKMSVTFQRFSGSRLIWQPATDDGFATVDPGGGEDRYRRADEFLRVAKGVWAGAPFSSHGTFFEVADGGFAEPLAGQPFPPVFLSGSSDEDLALTGAHGDVHVTDLGSEAELAAVTARVDDAASRRGRSVEHGVRVTVLARPTADEAWAEVRRLWRRGDTAGRPDVDDLRHDDQRWSGFDRLGAAPAGLVGSYDDVAVRLDDLRRAGARHLLLSGVAAVDEAYRTGHHVLPRLAVPAGR